MLIAIAGAIGSGKSRIAARLVDRYGFRVVSYGDALREEVLGRLPRTVGALHDLDAGCDGRCYRSGPGAHTACLRDMIYNRKPYGVRELLQEYGSEVRRADDPDYWVKRWAQSVSNTTNGRPVGERHVVAPDCRFPNEARAVRAMGGQLWRVERPGCVGTGHVSETALAHWHDYDAVLVNDGTLVDLYVEIERRLRPSTVAQADGADAPVECQGRA